jgi:hypothetical protein
VKRAYAVLLLLLAGAWAAGAQGLTLPNRPASLKFAAIGDNGTGELPEYDVGRQSTGRIWRHSDRRSDD